MADWVSEPTILWVLDTTMSAPSDSAGAGSAGGRSGARPRPRPPPAARRASAPPRPAPATSATAPKYVGETAVAPTASGVSVSARSSVSGARQWAMPRSGSTSGETKRGVRPGQDAAVDRAGVRVALHHHAVSRVGQRQQRDVVGLRGAVAQEPGALGAPGLGGQPLGLLERRGVGRADVDAGGQRRDVQRQRLLARWPRAARGRPPRRPCGRARTGARGPAPRGP